ncbi:hypothetical protein TrRE_jg13578 [Triparma retinervis]|uniref:Tudor domain-containing protein n=1 Tax=Triparma retinervis TaxID=2557542 RepID=A0A9W7G5T5_9STRA|nr:hypothetical protein TrRE_jg13578 [Triparma retinervis]
MTKERPIRTKSPAKSTKAAPKMAAPMRTAPEETPTYKVFAVYYEVAFDNGECDQAVHPKNIKFVSRGDDSDETGSYVILVGDVVEAKLNGKGEMIPGSGKGDDTHDEKLDDGDQDEVVELDETPEIINSETDAGDKLEKGDKVVAKLGGKGEMFPGKVHGVNSDGTYEVKFDDGVRDKAVQPKNIKAMEPKIIQLRQLLNQLQVENEQQRVKIETVKEEQQASITEQLDFVDAFVANEYDFTISQCPESPVQRVLRRETAGLLHSVSKGYNEKKFGGKLTSTEFASTWRDLGARELVELYNAIMGEAETVGSLGYIMKTFGVLNFQEARLLFIGPGTALKVHDDTGHASNARTGSRVLHFNLGYFDDFVPGKRGDMDYTRRQINDVSKAQCNVPSTMAGSYFFVAYDSPYTLMKRHNEDWIGVV